MGMLHYLITEPMQYRKPALGWFRFWQMLHSKTNGALDQSYAKLSRLWQPRVDLPPSKQIAEPARAGVVAELLRDGFALLPIRLTAGEIADLKQFAFSTPCYGKSLTDTYRFDETSIPATEGRYTWRTSDVIRHPVVQRLIQEGPYCAIAQDYLGCRPQLVSVTLWLNPPFKGFGANSYHYDNDGPGFLKYFLLLTDMEIGTGAHYFVKGSHTHTKPKGVAAPALYQEETVFKHYDRSREHVAGGSAGTIFAEDTMGFHRGSDLTQGYRMLLQLQFSVIDIPIDEDLEGMTKPVAVPGLDPAIEKITHKFYRRGSGAAG